MKIISKKTLLETSSAICDFCQEKVDFGICGSFKVKQEKVVIKGEQKVIKDWKYDWRGRRIAEGELEWITIYEKVEKEEMFQPVICKECIKQIYQQIK